MASTDGLLDMTKVLSYNDWLKPSQAKWFKAGQNMNDPMAAYAAWLDMLRQRAAQPRITGGAPPPGGQPVPNPSDGLMAPPPGGGGGRGGNQSRPGGNPAGAAGPSGAGSKPWVNPNRPAGAPNSFAATPKPGLPGGGAPPPSNPFVPAGSQPQQQWGNKENGGPGAEQAGNPALAMIAHLLRNQRQYGARTGMGSKE